MADSLEYRRKFFAGNVIFLGILFLILVAVFLLRDLLGGAKWDLTSDKVYTISDATKEILSKLKDEVTVNYYASEDLPGQLKTLKRDTKDMFDEFYELSNHKVNYAIVNPEEKALAYAEERVKEYFADKGAGKTPKEPEPPQTIQQIFGGRKPPSTDEIKANRERTAATLAAQQQRTKDDVYKELLTEEFKRQHLQKLEQEGIGSFPFNEREAASVRQGRVFSSIEIKYLDKEPEVIPVHYQLESLEYELASRILKLTTVEKPVVAFFDARKPDAPPPNPMNPTPPPPSDYEQISRALGEIFDVRSVNLKEGDSLDDLVKRIKEDRFRKETEDKDEAEKKELEAKQDKEVKPEELKRFIKCLVVAQPDQLEPRRTYEISRAVSLGVPTIFLVSRYSMDISEHGLQQGIPLNMISPGVEDMFRKWGIEIGHEVLGSNESGSIMVPRRLGQFQMMVPSQLSAIVAATQDSIDQSSPITNRIPSIIFPATTGLKLLADTLQKNGLKADVLAKTAAEASWSVKVDPFQKRNPFQPNAGFGATISQYNEDLVQPKNPREFRDWVDPVPLAVLLHGKMPFAYEGETIPEWKKEEKGKDKDGDDPHAGIPGLPGLQGLPDFGGDKDLALNALDPQDAKPAAPASGTSPQPAPAPPAPASQPAAQAAPPAQPPAVLPPAAPPVAVPTAALPATQPAPAVQPAPAIQPAPTPPAPAATAQPAAAPGSKPEEKAAEPLAEKPKASVQPVETNVLVLGSVDMMKDEFLVQQSREYQANVNFFYNAIENFGLGNQLIQIRRKQLTERHFKPGSEKSAGFIKWFNIAGLPALVGIFGLVYFLVRRADSVAYERRFIQKQQS